MKYTFTTLLLLLSVNLLAAPKWAKTASKCMATLYAVQNTNDTLQSNAFFIDAKGTVAVPFKTIQNARSGWIETNGKRYDVYRITGFNSTYNVATLLLTGVKKSVSLPLAEGPATKGQALFLTPQSVADEVVEVEKAGEYNYYTLKSPSAPELAGSPVVSEDGRVAAILQTPVTIKNAPNYALDIRFVQGLKIRPIDANHPDLRQCNIPQLLPDDEEQATSFLYIAGNVNDDKKAVYYDDFLRAFPSNPTGYILKAELQVRQQNYDQAQATLQEGTEKAHEKANEIQSAWARLLYNMAIQGVKWPGKDDAWLLEQAQENITQAIAANPLPLYTLQQANILYARKQYDEAYRRFMELTQTPMRSAELFLYAWQCQQNLGATPETLLALNDSAVACFTKPYPTAAAPYLFLRSNTLRTMGRLREAINGYNDYEHLMQGQPLSAEFYYQREQMEVATRMYGPAVNDIQRAIALAPGEPIFRAESATLFFRLNDLDNAILECERAIQLDDKFPDAYRIWGICLREKGNMAGAREKLEKAIELGDTLAKDVLEKL